MQAEIRNARAEDLASIRRITERAYAVWLPVLGFAPLPVVEDYAPRIARGEVRLACEHSEVVGLIVVESHDGHDLIFNVAVDPDHAGGGLGSRLIADAERRAKANGKCCIKLYTNALMSRNIAFYLKLGYVETDRRAHPSRAGSTIVDMAKNL